MASSFRNYEKDFYKRKLEMNNINNPKPLANFQDITLQGNGTKSRSKQKAKSNTKDRRLSPYYQKPMRMQKENKPFHKNSILNNYGNININVNNLIISNPPNNSGLANPIQNSSPYGNNNNIGLYMPNNNSGSVFSKLGYDIIGKKKKNNPNNNYSMINPSLSVGKQKPLQNNKLNLRPSNNTNNQDENINNENDNPDNRNQPKVENILNQNELQNVINDLMEITKNQENNPNINNNMGEDDDITLPEKKTKTPGKNEINVDTLNLNLNQNDLVKFERRTPMKDLTGTFNEINNINTVVVKQKIVIDNENDLLFNSFLWEKIFYFEIHYESKQNLSITEHLVLNELISRIEKKLINFSIFNQNNLNNCYIKMMKMLLIILIYIKFILLDFNYDATLKSQIKKMLNTYNANLLNILTTFVVSDDTEPSENDNFIKPNINYSKDFFENYYKVKRFHKVKKLSQGNLNIQHFAVNFNKSMDLTIASIKAVSNTYFKVGYFKPLHTIIMDLFRNIETITPLNFANLVVNHVLFYVIYFNQNEKQKEIVANKSIVFSPTNLLGLYGLNIGTAPAPFLPTAPESTYTLVLDLDETLVHFFYTPSGGTFLIRPHCFEFLQEMSEIFDIAIFTAAMKEYADGILNLIDKDKKYIKYRLYRNHTSISGMCFVKDLSKLGRDLKKVIIIDNICDNFKLQPNNGLGIKTWTEEIRDNQLVDMGNLLKDLVSRKPADVRPFIKKIKDEVNKRIRKNTINPYKNLSLDKLG